MKASKTILLALALLVSSCGNINEKQKLGEAQDCLDNVGDNYAAADACVAPIGDLDTAEANILKCSATFLGGGLTTSKVKQAIIQLRDQSVQNKELVFMGYLALPDQARADLGAQYCINSGSRGLIYIANAVRLGTLINLAIPGGYTPNPDPNDLVTAINGGAIPDATIGEIAVSVVGNYCTEATKDTTICKEFQTAVQSGSDNTQIGQLIRGYLTDNK